MSLRMWMWKWTNCTPLCLQCSSTFPLLRVLTQTWLQQIIFYFPSSSSFVCLCLLKQLAMSLSSFKMCQKLSEPIKLHSIDFSDFSCCTNWQRKPNTLFIYFLIKGIHCFLNANTSTSKVCVQLQFTVCTATTFNSKFHFFFLLLLLLLLSHKHNQPLDSFISFCCFGLLETELKSPVTTHWSDDSAYKCIRIFLFYFSFTLLHFGCHWLLLHMCRLMERERNWIHNENVNICQS